MMTQQHKITGVILAGGLARRMNNQDKGLVLYRNKAMISYAINAMTTIAEAVLLNANRNVEIYRQMGYPVISDTTDSFDGPLAGILVAMEYAQTEQLLVMPCDSPLITARHLEQLLNALQQSEATDIAVAFDGERLHPVFLALKTALKDSLKNYLQQGGRKIDTWLMQHAFVQVDFSQTPEVFLNINTLSELHALESQHGE